MTNRINKIMQLSDGSRYLIIKQAIYKNENYYVAAKVNDKETDVTDEVKIFHEFFLEEDPNVQEVTDPDTFKLILKYTGLNIE